MKNILPHKLMINFDTDGTFLDGILIYQKLEDSGLLSNKYHTISIKSDINIPVINGIILKAINIAKKQEGVNV